MEPGPREFKLGFFLGDPVLGEISFNLPDVWSYSLIRECFKPPWSFEIPQHVLNPRSWLPIHSIFWGGSHWKSLLVPNRSGMREWSITIVHDNPSNPSIPCVIHVFQNILTPRIPSCTASRQRSLGGPKLLTPSTPWRRGPGAQGPRVLAGTSPWLKASYNIP